MLSVISYQVNAEQNHNELSLHTQQNDYDLEGRKGRERERKEGR